MKRSHRKDATAVYVLTPDEAAVIDEIRSQGGDYAKIEKSSMDEVNALRRNGLVETGESDGFTVNVWLTKKGKKVAERI